MKVFRVEHKSFDKPQIRVTLYEAPYEDENILHKTGWKAEDVKLKTHRINENQKGIRQIHIRLNNVCNFKYNIMGNNRNNNLTKWIYM